MPSAVQLDRLPEVGVPRTGVTSVGLVDNTTLPVPVEVVTPVPPLATGKVPVAPEVRLTVPSVCFNEPLVSNVPSVVQVSPTFSVTLAMVRKVLLLLYEIVSVTAAVSLFSIVMVLITRRVAAAGAATRVTALVPLSAPSFAPSVKADPVSSAKAAVKSGFVVAAAPDMATSIDFVVASRIKSAMLVPHEINHANALEPPPPPPPDWATHASDPVPSEANT